MKNELWFLGGVVFMAILISASDTNSNSEVPSKEGTTSEYQRGYSEGYHKAMENMEYMRQSITPDHG